MTYRETIRREARRQGLSGYALGKRSGVAIRTVQRYLSDTTDVASETLEALAAALGLTLAKRKATKK